jgi:hypothetical protein
MICFWDYTVLWDLVFMTVGPDVLEKILLVRKLLMILQMVVHAQMRDLYRSNRVDNLPLISLQPILTEPAIGFHILVI